VLKVYKLRLNTSVLLCHFSHVSLCLTHNFITWKFYYIHATHFNGIMS